MDDMAIPSDDFICCFVKKVAFNLNIFGCKVNKNSAWMLKKSHVIEKL